jgi:hypothetical protein
MEGSKSVVAMARKNNFSNYDKDDLVKDKFPSVLLDDRLITLCEKFSHQ